MEAKNTLEYKMFFISFMFLNSKLRELKIPVSQCIKSLINDDINPKLEYLWQIGGEFEFRPIGSLQYIAIGASS